MHSAELLPVKNRHSRCGKTGIFCHEVEEAAHANDITVCVCCIRHRAIANNVIAYDDRPRT